MTVYKSYISSRYSGAALEPSQYCLGTHLKANENPEEFGEPDVLHFLVYMLSWSMQHSQYMSGAYEVLSITTCF